MTWAESSVRSTTTRVLETFGEPDVAVDWTSIDEVDESIDESTDEFDMSKKCEFD